MGALLHIALPALVAILVFSIERGERRELA
jgi:hypothetical protein